MRKLILALCVALACAPAAGASASAQATLTVSVIGTGAGLVTSVPAGINCGETCSGQFASGTTIELLAHGAVDSTFEAYSANCMRVGSKNLPPGPALCKVTLNADTSVAVIFNRTSTHCVVPKVKGKLLRQAEFSLARASCGVGAITLVHSRTVRKGHVTSQFPRAGWEGEHGAPVNLRVSKGAG